MRVLEFTTDHSYELNGLVEVCKKTETFQPVNSHGFLVSY